MLFPALSSSVFRTKLRRQQRELCQKVFYLLQSVLSTFQKLLVGWLLATNRNVGLLGVIIVVFIFIGSFLHTFAL